MYYEILLKVLQSLIIGRARRFCRKEFYITLFFVVKAFLLEMNEAVSGLISTLSEISKDEKVE